MVKKAHPTSANDSAYFAELIQLSTDIETAPLLDILLKQRPIDAKSLRYLVSYLKSLANSQRQQDAANKKHIANKAARQWVQKFWHQDRSKYSTNIEFSTIAASKVVTKFKVSIKPETIARDWLRGVGESDSMKVIKHPRAYVDGKYIGRKLYIKTGTS